MLGRRVSAARADQRLRRRPRRLGRRPEAARRRLLAFYGQHEHRKLTIASAQMEILDGFAGAEQLERRARYREAHRECCALGRELAELREREGSRERDLDLYRYELAEIEEVAPDAEEEAELAGERERLRHAEGAARGGRRGAARRSPAPTRTAGRPRRSRPAEGGARRRRAGVDPALDALAERVGALARRARRRRRRAARLRRGDRGRPGRLRAVEERLDALDRLKRKHGGSVESVLAHAERCRAEIARLEGAEERGAEARGGAGRGRGAAAPSSAGELSRRARKAARRLGEAGRGRAGAAGDGAARGSRSCSSRTRTASAPAGRETVELRVAPNPGMRVGAAPRRGLGRRALAGDARARGLGPRAGAATLVFDEIDAGVGGKTARAVGERLRALGEERQVICITHLPQVASLAATHFRIEKDVGAGGRPRTGRARRRRRAGRGDRAACSAPSAATRPPTATPASCSTAA